MALAVLSVFVIGTGGTVKRRKGNEAFMIVQRHYGVDAAGMEHSAAVPLEDALTRLRGVKKIRSTSENSAVRVFVYFEGNGAGRYEAVREAAQSVYESLPPSAQRPEIFSSGGTRVPLWTAAVSPRGDVPLGKILERTVKPVLEGLEGAGEVEVSGTGLNEIIIALNPEKAAAWGLSPNHVAEFLSANDMLFPGGNLKSGGKTIPLVIDGRYADLEALRKALIPVQYSDQDGTTKRNLASLGDIAELTEQEREGETRSRLNGKQTAVIAVMGGPGTDPGKLSREIKKELEQFSSLPLEFTVLSDRGEEERAAFRSVLGAALQGSFAVALMALLLCAGRSGNRRFSLSLVCALTVPAAALFSAALLSAAGIELDKLAMAGLSAGVGAAVDAAILGAEQFRTCTTIEEGRGAFSSLCFPLISGSLTTIIALLPLLLNGYAGGILRVAWAVGAVNFVSMVLALTLLPPLFLWGIPQGAPAAGTNRPAASMSVGINKFYLSSIILFRKFCRRLRRLSAFQAGFCALRPLVPVGVWVLITVAGLAALLAGGADTGQQGSEDSVYAQVEFEGGLHVEETDRLLAAYAEKLSSAGGIIYVQTGAKTGSGSVLVRFDKAVLKSGAVRDLTRNIPIPGAFVYIGESSMGERNWEITIAGDDGKRCREIASEAARICGSLPIAKETVLYFKEGSPRLSLNPDRLKLASLGLSFSGLGGIVRQGIYGPVTYKRLDHGGETDVRIRGMAGIPRSKTGIGDILLSGGAGPLRLDSLVSGADDTEPSSIVREDRRRIASISIRTAAMDPRRVRDEVMPALAGLELPPGYRIEFDREALKAAEAVSSQGFLFVLALIFCYMVIAAARESFVLPLAVLSVVPPSLAVPAFCLAVTGHGLNAETAAAFVAVSGMAVNAAVLTVDALTEDSRRTCGEGRSRGMDIYRALRKRLPVLAATTATTIAGAVPFLFLRSGAAAAVRSLSLITALGVAVSALCSITLIPALAGMIPGLLKKT
jgi:multidrug efflux pump subunit AcrB